MHEREVRDRLIPHVREQRIRVSTYVERMRPRSERLANIGIVATGVAAACTAGPALGGQRFSEAVQSGLGLPTDDPVYQVLCLCALLAALVAATTVNFVKRQQVGTHVGIAEACGAELMGLETALEFDTLPPDEAIRQYQHCLQKVYFIPTDGETDLHEVGAPAPPTRSSSPTAPAPGPTATRMSVPPPGPRPRWPAQPPRRHVPANNAAERASETVVISSEEADPGSARSARPHPRRPGPEG